MKSDERKVARKLRSQGWSLRAIAGETQCSKSSISRWIQDIVLTPEQIEQLKSNQDKGRARAAQHPNSPKKKWEALRSKMIALAAQDIDKKYSFKELQNVGSALYWAEGYKAGRNVFVFSNSDPAMIKIMIKFLLKVCSVPPDKLRGRLNIHPHLDIERAKKYWSGISGIPLSQFHNTLLGVSKASKQKRDTLPLGTFNIVVSSVALCCKVKGWIKGLEYWGK